MCFARKCWWIFTEAAASSDGGASLLSRKYRVTKQLGSCLGDIRDAARIRHEVLELFRQRVYCIALGYEDANDAGCLRDDPTLKLIAEGSLRGVIPWPPSPPCAGLKTQ